MEKNRRWRKWIAKEKEGDTGTGTTSTSTSTGTGTGTGTSTGTSTGKDMAVDNNDKEKTNGVEVEDSVQSPLNTQPFVGNPGEDKITINSKRVKRRVGDKAHCTFCGSEGVIVEKYSKR